MDSRGDENTPSTAWILAPMAKNANTHIVEKTRQEISQAVFGDPREREHLQRYIAVAGPLLAELTALGYDIDTLDDLRHQGRAWKTAFPVLLRALPLIDEPSVKESIVRCLSVPWVGSKATPGLIAEFKRYAPIVRSPSNPWAGNELRELSDDEKKTSAAFSLAWTIGNALSIVEVKGFEPQIIEICRNPAYGMARQMVVLGLGRLRSSEAEETAVELLKDEGVRLHAIGALRKMKSRRALFELEKLLSETGSHSEGSAQGDHSNHACLGDDDGLDNLIKIANRGGQSDRLYLASLRRTEKTRTQNPFRSQVAQIGKSTRSLEQSPIVNPHGFVSHPIPRP